MRNSMLEISGHLSNETIMQLKDGKLTQAESIDALMHIGECKVCADYFANCFEKSEFLEGFPDFGERVVKEALSHKDRNARPDRAARMREFHLYAVRVAVAMCLTLMMLFTSPFQMAVNAIEIDTIYKINEISISKVDDFNENVRNITDRIATLEINKLEGNKYDQKKK